MAGESRLGEHSLRLSGIVPYSMWHNVEKNENQRAASDLMKAMI